MLKEREMGADVARPRQSVQSVERTLDLLEALAAAQGEVSITNLAQRTGLHVSTVHRLLATLVHRGYVRQNRESSRYYLGSKMALLGEGAPRYTELRLQAQTALSALTDLIDETTNLVVLEDTAAVYIDQVQCKQVVRLFTAIGNRVPLQCTAAWLFFQEIFFVTAEMQSSGTVMNTMSDRSTTSCAQSGPDLLETPAIS